LSFFVCRDKLPLTFFYHSHLAGRPLEKSAGARMTSTSLS